MKFLEEVPWFICDEGDTNFCAYSDTDSVYLNAQPLAEHLYPNFNYLPEKEQDDIIEKLALTYQDIITNHYNVLAKECFNIEEHRLEMKTEAVIRSAYFRATRRYAQWITKQEGIVKETLDVKGLEYKKSNFPKVFGNFFKQVVEDILKGYKQKEIDKRILDFKKEILTKIPIEQLGNPTAVKTLNKYIERKPVGGEAFTVVAKGAPASVRATIKYNDLLKYWKLDSKHSPILQGDKVKWIYLKKNPYNIEALAYLDFNIPDKIREFLDKFSDKEKVFDTILLNKLKGLYDDLGWKLNTNPYVNQFFI
jgi:DNA polymerase elongation subunit (family B)